MAAVSSCRVRTPHHMRHVNCASAPLRRGVGRQSPRLLGESRQGLLLSQPVLSSLRGWFATAKFGQP